MVDIRMRYRFAATMPDSWTLNMVAFEFSESSSDRCSFICFKVNWPNSQQLGFGPKYLSILVCALLLPAVPTPTLTSIEEVPAHASTVEHSTTVEETGRGERVVKGARSHGLACVVALSASIICCVHMQALATPNCIVDTGQVTPLTASIPEAWTQNMIPPI